MLSHITQAQFIATKTVINDQQDIARFIEAYDCTYYTDYPVKALYAYSGNYYIREQMDGTFTCVIGDDEKTGTLARCEAYLYRWAALSLVSPLPPVEILPIPTPHTLADVKRLFQNLVKLLGLGFHPDTHGADYVNMETQEYTFTTAEAEAYDKAMEAAFTICEQEEMDPYELGMDYMQPLIDQHSRMKTTEEKIKWLNDFIARWNAVNADRSLTHTQHFAACDALSQQLAIFCRGESLPVMSADDLLVTLKKTL